MLPEALLTAVDRALDRRQPLLESLAAADTACCRLFHGIAEAEPGLTIDRYGTLLLLQTFRAPQQVHMMLSHDDAEALGSHVARRIVLVLAVAANLRGGTHAAPQAHAPG